LVNAPGAPFLKGRLDKVLSSLGRLSSKGGLVSFYHYLAPPFPQGEGYWVNGAWPLFSREGLFMITVAWCHSSSRGRID